ncbi:hypothetical protein [Bacillus sp. Marseille-P3800]|uniref:hypothetical protein n=1 Tax=Bacillus sp. Marseille-P3800 TaxID=2014782 RepID=UPI00159B90FB|nr:hypothetical protein [Bacillus sp. Marseille-P3800]
MGNEVLHLFKDEEIEKIDKKAMMQGYMEMGKINSEYAEESLCVENEAENVTYEFLSK